MTSRQAGLGEVIAILDTGLAAAGLSELAGRLVDAWNEILMQPGAFDDNGHGTEVTAVAVGGGDKGVWGLAPGARVMPIKVADAQGRAEARVVAAAIMRAIRSRATVINISLASEMRDADIAAAIQIAVGAGVVVVAAAGDAGEAGPQFPASEPGVVATYAQDPSGGVAERFNRPAGPAAMAPGIGVGTVAPADAGLTPVRVSGTSVAAAIMSGLLADCLGAAKRSGRELRQAIGVCESRVIRSPEQRGFVSLKSLMEA